MTLHHAPCGLLSVDHQDKMGEHKVDIGDGLFKTRVSKDGEDIVGGEILNTAKHVQASIDNGEGCRVHGGFSVKKVPGNFHLSFHGFHDLFHDVRGDFLFSHTINHLSFGRQHRNEYISNMFGEGTHTDFAPYDGHSEVQKSRAVTSYEYYLDIIPIQY